MFSYLVENSMYKKKKIECNNLIKDKNPIRNKMSINNFRLNNLFLSPSLSFSFFLYFN